MPRSRNLANYETIYWDLLSAMQDGVPELVFKLPKKVAINMQQTFYSFIRATEHASNVKNIGGDVKHAKEFTDNANTMRGYLAIINHEPLESTIRFINRDLNPATQSIRDQLQAQLNTEDKNAFFESLNDTEIKHE